MISLAMSQRDNKALGVKRATLSAFRLGAARLLPELSPTLPTLRQLHNVPQPRYATTCALRCSRPIPSEIITLTTTTR